MPSVVIGIFVGAALGAAAGAITGGDPGRGALFGAVTGGIGGGIAGPAGGAAGGDAGGIFGTGITWGQALLAGGTLLASAGQLREGQAQADLSGFTAATQERQAAQEIKVAQAQERDFVREQSRLMARRRALLGASGVLQTTGSPLLTAQDFAGESAVQSLRIRQGGELRSTRLQESAVLERLRGQNERTSSFIGAGSSLLTGLGRVFQG